MAQRGPVKEIADELGRIFRHLLPGVLIVAAARLSHPGWFAGSSWGEPRYLMLLTVVAIMVGNTWYVVHRYTLHELINMALYHWVKKPPLFESSGYPDWLAKLVHASHLFPPHGHDLREHIWFRSAQVIYLAILGEVLLIFALLQPDPCSFFGQHRWWLVGCGVVVLLFAFWQHFLTHKIDRHAASQLGAKRMPAE